MINIGIIGYGYWGPNLRRMLPTPSVMPGRKKAPTLRGVGAFSRKEHVRENTIESEMFRCDCKNGTESITPRFSVIAS